MSKKNIIKIILLGESGVGKTCLIQSYLGKQFIEERPATISCESYIKPIIKNNITYNIQLWDTAGQERFRSMSKIFIKESQIVVFVYDITSQRTFNELPFWVKYAEDLLGKDIVFGLAGNKVDLFDSDEIDKDVLVNTQNAKKYASEIGASFSETSAKVNPKAFQKYIEQLIDIFLSKRNVTANEWEVVTLDKVKVKKKKHKCCKI